MRDERVILTKRKIQSDGFTLVWFLLLASGLLRERLPGHTSLAAAFVWRQSEWLQGETVPLRGSGLELRWPVVVQVEPSQSISDMGAYSVQPPYQSMGKQGKEQVILCTSHSVASVFSINLELYMNQDA